MTYTKPILRWGALLCLLVRCGTSWAMDDCAPHEWPTWTHFKQTFISQDGRVIDPASPNRYTTSEGQSYALFFSLVDNDPVMFERLLHWTENNLAQGDLSAHLPAWQWGRSADGSWRVQDSNPATDADLWLAYTLTEAGRLWQQPRYSALGKRIAERILAQEQANLPNLGPMLLPGIQGFHPTPDAWRLNPSYFPPQIFLALGEHYPTMGWDDILTNLLRMMEAVSAHRVAPDWLGYQPPGFMPDPETGDVGSYNAIRVYLWVGMMASSPLQQHLLGELGGMADYIDAHGVPPITTHWLTGQMEGNGSPGFSAAMVPYLANAGRNTALASQLKRLNEDPNAATSANYYDQALTLFGMGWFDNRFQFSEKGALMPHGSCAPNTAPH